MYSPIVYESGKNAALAGRVYIWSVEWSTSAYSTLIRDNKFMQAMLVSLERVPLGGLPVYNMILLLNFFRNEPKDIKEAATIDGVNPFQMMLRIYVPLTMPAIAMVTVFSVVNRWNNFFDGLLLISSPEKIPLQT